MCISCSSKRKMENLGEERRRALALNASLAAAKSAPDRWSAYRKKYGEDYILVRAIAVGARQRCGNKNDAAWENYGGRGIKFKFKSAAAFAEWVLDNLGPRPSDKHSIDRIDNNRHYERGNLRWATRSEQARNKRPYKGGVYGRRMHKLMAARPDYTYEGLRKYVNLGYTDEQIINMEKPKGGRPRKQSTSI